MSKPKNHTEDCECPLCDGLSPRQAAPMFDFGIEYVIRGEASGRWGALLRAVPPTDPPLLPPPTLAVPSWLTNPIVARNMEVLRRIWRALGDAAAEAHARCGVGPFTACRHQHCQRATAAWDAGAILFGEPIDLPKAVAQITKTGDVRLVFSDGHSRPASPTDGQWPPLVGNALTRYQKERALLAAVTAWGQRSDEYRDAMIHDDPGCVHYQEVRLALREAIAAVDCCWRDLQAVGGPLP